MRKTVNGADFKQMLINATVLVGQHKQDLNDLNVFPVPDGDTGTNMFLTMNHAVQEMLSFESDRLTKAADRISSMLLRGAHGNSGSITSLLFSGMAKQFKEHDSADSALFAAGMKAGVDKAYSALLKPAEGTILSVARKASERAVQAAETVFDIEEVVTEALEEALLELEKTPQQNPVLAKAGVVDAGAMGYCFILEGFLAALRGQELTPGVAAEIAVRRESVFEVFDASDITFGYCTEFIIEKHASAPGYTDLRSFLDGIGDSVVVVDDEDIIKVHVHTDNPGKALEEALRFGSLGSIKIDNMREQHSHQLETSGGARQAPAVAAPEKKYGFVAIAAGEGIESVFKDLGVDQLVQGGQTMNPSTEDILTAANKTPAEVVFVFPNNKNIFLSADQAAELCEKKVVVVYTRTVPEGISAMLAFSEEASEEENAEMMQEAFAAVRTGQLTYAARDSSYDGLDIKEGDYLALRNGKLSFTGPDLRQALRSLVFDLDVENASFVTVFCGADTAEEQNEELEGIIRKNCGAGTEVNFIYGGQPVYYYIIGVE